MQPQRLIVPLFQRRYVWNQESQWEPLWNDVLRVADRMLQQPHLRPQPHFRRLYRTSIVSICIRPSTSLR